MKKNMTLRGAGGTKAIFRVLGMLFEFYPVLMPITAERR